jgi:hypothetical protein
MPLHIAHALLLRADAIDTAGIVVAFTRRSPRSRRRRAARSSAREEHFRKAHELSGGRRIGPLVTLAEAVCVKVDLFVEVTP